MQLKPFCYFCNREFDDEKVLIQHQKAKHFKCGECHRKLETANGLAVHMQQVHRMTQRRVPNAMEGRDDVTSVVQGMFGIPFDIVEEHQMKHYKKMGDIDTKKQQRISWAIVAAAPTPEQFIAQLSIGNIYFPGFTAMPENHIQQQRLPPPQHAYGQMQGQVPPYGQTAMGMPPQGHAMPYGVGGVRPGVQPAVHGYQKAGFSNDDRGSNFSSARGRPGFQSRDEVNRGMGFSSTSTGPLILGPKGIPVESSKAGGMGGTDSARSGGFTPATGYGSNNLIGHTPRGFSDAPTAIPKTGGFSDAKGFSKPSGFSDGPAPGVAKGFSKPTGFSDAPVVPKPALQRADQGTRSFSTTPRTDASPTEKQKAIQTQYYKAAGVAPLFIPPPALGNTKLAYDVDAVSIEETRAKVIFKCENIF